MNAKILDINGSEAVVSLEDTTTFSIPIHTISNNYLIGDTIKLDTTNIPKAINNGHTAPLCQKLMDFF